MIYEATITFVTVDDNGNDKKTKEKYIVDGVDTFTEVESKLRDMFGTLTDFDVTAIKRSRIAEIANKAQEARYKIFLAETAAISLQDDGSEKEIRYKIAFHESNIETAHEYIKKYLSQGYGMELRGIKETNYKEVL